MIIVSYGVEVCLPRPGCTRRIRISLLLLFSLFSILPFALCLPAQSLPEDRHWSGDYDFPGTGTDGPVKQLLHDDFGNLYVRGAFTRVGTLPANRLACWNGKTWSWLQGGIQNGSIQTMISDGQGGIYVGGQFTEAGGIPVRNIAHWNGSAWDSLGPGLANRVEQMLLSQNKILYAEETVCAPGTGSLVSTNLHTWNGKSWKLLGTVPGDGGIREMILDLENNLYVGGYFSRVNDTETGPLARWNGSEWSAAGESLEKGSFFTMKLDREGNLWVAGKRWVQDNTYQQLTLSKWDGRQWISVLNETLTGRENQGRMVLLSDYFGNIYEYHCTYRAGDWGEKCSAMRKWDGKQWCDPPQWEGKALFPGIVDNRGHSFSFVSAAEGAELRLIRLTESGWVAVSGRWKKQDISNGYSESIAWDGKDTYYYGGYFTQESNPNNYNLSRCKNNAWGAFTDSAKNAKGAYCPSLIPGNASITYRSDDWGNLYSLRQNRANGVVTTVFSMWSQESWNVLCPEIPKDLYVHPVSLGKNRFSHLIGISTEQRFDGQYFQAHRLLQWNGSVWHDSGVEFTGNIASVKSDLNGRLYLAGFREKQNGESSAYVSCWDGKTWISLDYNLNTFAAENYHLIDNMLLAIDHRGSLFLSFHYRIPNHTSPHPFVYFSFTGLWQLEGDRWSPVRSDLALKNGIIQQMVFDRQNRLIVGGSFTEIAGVEANRIARWDGSRWMPLGNGFDGPVTAMVFDHQDHLVAGGSFLTADNRQASSVARWDGDSWSSFGSGLSDPYNPNDPFQKDSDNAVKIHSLAAGDTGSIFVTGNFRKAGGKSSYGIAEWRERPYVSWIPVLEGDANRYTGIALANPEATAQSVRLTAFGSDGRRLALPGMTNPVLTTMMPGQQQARIDFQVFDFPMEESRLGSIRVESSSEKVSASFLLGDIAQSYLNGGLAESSPQNRLIFTRPMEGFSPALSGMVRTNIDLLNPGEEDCPLTLTLFDEAGRSTPAVQERLPAHGRYQTTLSELFPQRTSPFYGGYLEVKAGCPIAGYQRTQTLFSRFGLPAQAAKPVDRLTSAQFASGGWGFFPIPYFTDLTLSNVDSRSAAILTLRLIDGDGKLLPAPNNPLYYTLEPKHTLTGRADHLFGLPPAETDRKARTGSLQIEIRGGLVVGDAIFGNALQRNLLAALPLQAEYSSDILFPHVAEGVSGADPVRYFTGIAAFNPGTEPVEVILEVYSAQGKPVGTHRRPLAAGARFSQTIGQLIPMAIGQIGGYLRLRSEGGTISAMELIGDAEQQRFLCPVLPHSLPPVP